MKLFLLLMLLQKQPVPVIEPLLDSVRHLYHKASTDKKASVKLSLILEKVDTSFSPVLVCYKGVASMIKAKYTVSPFAKLKDFNEGKVLIEKAVQLDSSVMETRFVRFTIQTNAPSFLKYNSSITADKKFLLAHFNDIGDLALKDDIYRYLSGSAYCTEDELKKLKRTN